ncbi:PQQ-like domain-containing protein [Natronobacterium gregoryi]|nr:PQQ enzyme repeat-containing protein [Natronobacterium gregoryi SP2]SFJ36069.1 PQQ-like domain-containing protein [Natronobacterium gregoryi]
MEKSRFALLERETGSTLWETTVPDPAGPPVVADGVAYAGGAHLGQPSIDVEVRDETDAEPAVEGSLPAESGTLSALDVETGDVLWQRTMGPSRGGYALAPVDDVLVVGTSDGIVVLE